MFQFPFGTMHQLNLDWFLQKFNELLEEWSNAEAGIDGSLQAEIDRVEAAMTDLYAARDAAVNAADAAVPAAASAVQDALISEGFALGEQNGTPVGAGSPYYQANAKFYSTTAGTYRYLSEAYARGTMGGTPVDPGDAGYEDNAKYYKDAADIDASTASGAATSAAADALIAEGYAVGEQNGTPVSSGSPYYENNAKYFHQQTAQDKSDTDTLKDAANNAALRAEGYSSGTQNGTPVSSGSPYYENNAAYFYSQAAGTSGDLAQAMIAEEEASSSAAAAHAVGDYFRYNGILYQATADIDIGDTITPGTNCEQAVLADAVAEMEKSSSPRIGSYLYKRLHTGDMPATTMASRTIEIKDNMISQSRNGASSSKVIINLIGNSARVGNTSLADYTPNASELDEIDNIAGATIKAYQIITGLGGSSNVGIAVGYYKIEADNYVYIGLDKLTLGYSANANAFIKTKLTIPVDAEYYGLFFISDNSNSQFTAIFEFDV